MTSSTTALAPNSTIGILGGGQLGRMLASAAARLGYQCHIFDPAADGPAAQVAHRHTQAVFDDTQALAHFATQVDVVTYEFENIPTAALDTLSSVPHFPPRRALEVSQARLTEKQFFRDLGLMTAPFAPVNSQQDLDRAIQDIGAPGILKTNRLGYDGKGQQRISQPGASFTLDTECIYEGFVSFTSEISVIATRGQDGQTAAFDPGENLHEQGILRTTTVPANIPARLATDAVLIAAKILNALDYVGTIGVELFVTPQGLVVNEIAPRVHNSGHWTQNATASDQFEQHIRAIAGLPLGDGRRYANVQMENLIGDDMDKLPALLAEPNAILHLYGKAETRPGRKMGHVNRIRA